MFTYKKRSSARAEHTPGKSYEPSGEKPPLGEGGRFEALKESIAARGNVRNPGAVAASIGRKKYGAKRFAQLSAIGRKLNKG